MTAYSQQQHRHPLNYFTFGKIKTDRKSITKFKLNTVKNKNCLSEWSLTIHGHFVSVIVDPTRHAGMVSAQWLTTQTSYFCSLVVDYMDHGEINLNGAAHGTKYD